MVLIQILQRIGTSVLRLLLFLLCLSMQCIFGLALGSLSRPKLSLELWTKDGKLISVAKRKRPQNVKLFSNMSTYTVVPNIRCITNTLQF
jgi:hypothetical protein